MDENIRDALASLGVSRIDSEGSAGGGTFGQTTRISTDRGPFFIKQSASIPVSHFTAEALGLQLMAQTKTIRVPIVHATGPLSSGHGGFLICEYLNLSRLSRSSQRLLGHQLAKMHLMSMEMESVHGGQFGLSQDGSCGATPQINTPTSNWAEFFAINRVRFLCERIHREYGDGELMELGKRLEEAIPRLMEGAGQIRPALIHGDLWGGNAAQLSDGSPVIFDPAAYFAHSEAELGMMHEMGGFSRELYDAYHALIPKAPGFEQRLNLYSWYHIANHYSLFGTGYRSHALQLMRKCLEK